MGSLGPDAKLPWVRTPCVLNPAMSRIAGCNIYLKLENTQPSGSFKSRGIGTLMMRAAAAATGRVHFYCSSGGNAGLACATAAIALGHPATIVVPVLTSAMMKRKLEALGVDVHQVGENWAVADRYLREELLAKDPAGVYVPPFDHPHIWDGAATIVDELRRDFRAMGDVPIDAIVCSVGGGGLVNGLMQGVEGSSSPAAPAPASASARDSDSDTAPAPTSASASSWPGGVKPAVIAVETHGADSLNASIRANAHTTLPAITSVAISLGAPRVSEQTWNWARHPTAPLRSLVVSDADAALSCVRFADDARAVVEPACGATLAVAYQGDLRRELGGGLDDAAWARKNVVLVVCGGQGTTVEMLAAYRQKYAGQSSIEV